jgi:MSHA biogenesis protein MshP
MKRMRGFALVAAIFLLVILAMLGAYMVSFSSAMHIASAQDIQGARAYRAAQFGIEWAMSALCNGGSCSTPLTACPTISSPLHTTPEGFAVNVTCTRRTFNEAGPGGSDLARNMFFITSTANSGGTVGNLGYIERSHSAWIEFPG